MPNKRSKKYYYLAVLAITIVGFVFQLLTHYIFILIEFNFLGTIILFLLSSFVFSLLITTSIFMFLPMLSEAMITLRRMLRVENLSNPLLLKLSTKAPGTYHHSLNVSTLAQKAAKAIGADSLLVRTAAYYHDIGKIDSPETYIENQNTKNTRFNGDDIDTIKKDAQTIIQHVEKGVEIARKNNLPEEVINLITEHHGTTRALYFYRIAQEKGYQIKKTDFRYPGPIPQTKESMVLMLSDCVEAAARATNDLTAQKIKEIVTYTIESKISENQLKNCGLSEFEIVKIQNSLEDTLRTIFHQRIHYKNEN